MRTILHNSFYENRMNEYIDHTVLKPDATMKDIAKLCKESQEYKFASVCIAPAWVDYCKLLLHSFSEPTPIATVIGFPHGNTTEKSKYREIKYATEDGATEHDVVINIGDVKSGSWSSIKKEIRKIATTKNTEWGQQNSILIKYIVEVGYLTDDELFKIADLLIKHEIDYIKTCTGYGPRGVTVEDIIKIKRHVGDAIKIKASGGIKTADFAKQLVMAGANRIGCSASVSIMNELKK